MIKLLRIVIAYAIAACMLLPFLWMMSTSFKNPADVFEFPIKWIPDPINLDGYRYVWQASVIGVPFYVFYWNSLKVAFLVLAGTFFSCTLAAYAYARIEFAGRSLIFMILIATMMIPFQVTMIPIFIMYKELGLLNTHMALWLPACFGSMFGVFLLRQFIKSIPMELSEAAVIDGAGHARIYWSIVLPLIKPAVTALLVLTLVSTWNNYEAPLLFLRSAELYTIPVGLKAMADDIYNINYSGIMAGVVSSIVPILLLFVFGQRYFVQGITFSVTKG